MAVPSDAAHPTSASLAQARLPRRARTVLQGLMARAGSQLDELIHPIMMETELSLARLPHSGDPKLEGERSASIRSLSGGLRMFSRTFYNHIETSLANLQEPRQRQALATPEATTLTLSLLDEDVISDEVLLDNMASRISSRNSLGLQLLGYRLGVLAGTSAFEADTVPLGPRQLCEALGEASDSLKLSRLARMHLFQQFERVLFEHYTALLDNFNAKLVESGILPHLSFIPVRVRANTSDGTLAADATPTAAAPHTDSNTLSPFGELVAPREPAAPLQPSNQEFALLQSMLGQRRSLLSKLRAAPTDDRLREELPHEDLLAALQQLSNGTTNKSDLLADLRQMLMAQTRQQRGHGVALSQTDNDSFDLLQLFMTQLQGKLRKSSPGEALIERLRLPLTQIALRDQEFFTNPSHPARELLDTLSEAGANWLAEDDMDAQWLGLLQRAASSVQQDKTGDKATFADANQTLQSGLQAMQRRAEMAERRQVDAARGREKLAVARQCAGTEIARLLADRTLPDFQARLMEETWTDVLSLAHLRGGEHSEAWQKLTDVTSRLLDACTSSKYRTASIDLIGQIRAALEQVGYHTEDAGAIARHLTNDIEPERAAASQEKLLSQLQARARLGEDAVEASDSRDLPQRTPQEQAAYEQLTQLRLPAWIDMDNEHGEPQRRRFAWASPATGLTLLVNRRGQRVGNDTLDTLARKLAAGQLRIVEHANAPANAAWKEALGNLQQLADTPGGTVTGAQDGR